MLYFSSAKSYVSGKVVEGKTEMQQAKIRLNAKTDRADLAERGLREIRGSLRAEESMRSA